MVQHIFAQTMAELKLTDFNAVLAIVFCDMLRSYSLREVSRHCRSLIANAIKNGRKEVIAADVQATGADRIALERIEPILRKSNWTMKQ